MNHIDEIFLSLKKKKMTRGFYIDRERKENYDVEKKTGIVYNGIVQQFGKGM
jgi:predicted RNA-binding protein YlxR (DUF448 family)